MTISLKLTTDNVRNITITHAYWSYGKNNLPLATVSKIAKHYGITKAELNTIVKFAGTARAKNVVCAGGCGAKPVLKNRAALTPILKDGWTCSSCEDIMETAMDRKITALLEHNIKKRAQAALTVADLSRTQQIYLLALLREGIANEVVSSLEETLAPAHKLDTHILEILHTEGMITIDPSSHRVNEHPYYDEKENRYGNGLPVLHIVNGKVKPVYRDFLHYLLYKPVVFADKASAKKGVSGLSITKLKQELEKVIFASDEHCQSHETNEFFLLKLVKYEIKSFIARRLVDNFGHIDFHWTFDSFIYKLYTLLNMSQIIELVDNACDKVNEYNNQSLQDPTRKLLDLCKLELNRNLQTGIIPSLSREIRPLFYDFFASSLSRIVVFEIFKAEKRLWKECVASIPSTSSLCEA